MTAERDRLIALADKHGERSSGTAAGQSSWSFNYSGLKRFAALSQTAPSKADYESVLADQRRLVRELDVILNGSAGAAEQASLCDIVSQCRSRFSAPPFAVPHAPAPVAPTDSDVKGPPSAEAEIPVSDVMGQAAPTEPSDCDSCEGTGSGGMGVGCTDCLGTGIDPHASPAPVAADTLTDEQIIRRAVQAMPHTNPEVAEDLLGGFTMHTEMADIVAIWRAASPARAIPAQEQADAAERYWTQPAESLMGIALRQLKDENRWTEIRDLNASSFPDMGPHDYYPVGTALKMPARNAQGESKP